MYNRFYGFRENPFNQTPDTDFFFPSEHHKAAMDAMLYAVRQRKGFVVITGEIGSGKTTVSRALLKKLGDEVKSAVITNTHLTPKGIILLMMEDLEIDYVPGSKEKLLIQLNEFLLTQASMDQTVVLLIDEAQNLSPACLEEVRMISNLETEKEKLVQIILMGQPELKSKLQKPTLEQLRQRIALRYELRPLTEKEVKDYIRYRLNLVKSNGKDMDSLFNEEALSLIYKHSRGLPRLINIFCDHALLTACVAEAKCVTPKMVEESVSEIRF
ncbi:MAG: AAA family ATPase [Candidatus Omnitrophica bacterium]|nr:AAA family ATPase [Candidatus Omnitrophota bacterium]